MCPQRFDFAIKRRKNKFSPRNFLRIPKIYLETRKKQNKYFGPHRGPYVTSFSQTNPIILPWGRTTLFAIERSKIRLEPYKLARILKT